MVISKTSKIEVAVNYCGDLNTPVSSLSLQLHLSSYSKIEVHFTFSDITSSSEVVTTNGHSSYSYCVVARSQHIVTMISHCLLARSPDTKTINASLLQKGLVSPCSKKDKLTEFTIFILGLHIHYHL